MKKILNKINWFGYKYNKQADVYNLLVYDLTLLLCCLGLFV